MATVVFPPETERSASDNTTNGSGGGGFDIPGSFDHHIVDLEPEQRATPASAYRLIMFLAMIWITALFATMTIVLEWRWVHSPNWISIQLPQILYVNAAILALSSVTIELARHSSRLRESQNSARWILVTLSLGFMALIGQAFAWRELSLRGLHLATNPGSFLLYLMTGTHAIQLLVGIAVLMWIGFQASRATRKTKWQTGMGTFALYWHFTDALWLYVVALLFVALQR